MGFYLTEATMTESNDKEEQAETPALENTPASPESQAAEEAARGTLPVDGGDTAGTFDIPEAAPAAFPPSFFGVQGKAIDPRQGAKAFLAHLQASPAMKVPGNPSTQKKLQARWLQGFVGALQGALERI